MKIHFVRHGQTKHNVAGLINSQLDKEDVLTDDGIEQVKKTMREIADDYTEIYSSDLFRTRQTAEILNQKLKLSIIYDARVRERNFGSLDGKSWEEVGLGLKELDLKQKYDYRPHGGESAEDVQKRLFDFIGELVRDKKSEKILVVTHGGTIRMLYHLLKGEYPEFIDNASLHEFEFPEI
jgi:alpha-ribazole phosphatase/probable phosphoglycerate mutase